MKRFEELESHEEEIEDMISEKFMDKLTENEEFMEKIKKSLED